ncbi:MAG: SH3 domain-containing protein [Rhodanobacteraceae bacterium]
MKKRAWLTLASLALALPVPLLALAQDGYLTADVNLRAGPDIGYPRIATLPAGTGISVQGCIRDYEWCDVIAYGDRGWVAGDYIDYEYHDQRVLLPEYGARIGIPIVSFVIGDYWGHYYRNRGFYSDRDRWYHRHFAYRPPPRPVYRREYGHRGGGRGGHENHEYGHSGSIHRGANQRNSSHYAIQRREPAHGTVHGRAVPHRQASGAYRGHESRGQPASHQNGHARQHDNGHGHESRDKKHKSDDHHH